jgi:hypothetical protein
MSDISYKAKISCKQLDCFFSDDEENKKEEEE